jgi:uncharacterized protein YdhG (YjbR/CyaY superfamily)
LYLKNKEVDQYIAKCPLEVQSLLEEIRKLIHLTIPEAGEKISYQIPAFYLDKILVYFGAFKKHIGFFPTAFVINEFKEELRGYKYSKGSVQFPINKPMPLELIKRMVICRLGQLEGQGEKKKVK